MISVDDIDYDLDLSFLKNPEEEARKKAEALARDQMSNINSLSAQLDKVGNKPAIPMVNRSTKPKPNHSLNNLDNANAITQVSQPQETRKTEPLPSKITNNLEDLRKMIGDEKKSNIPEKNTNIVKQGTVEVSAPKLPSVNRSLKPKPDNNSNALTHQDSSDSDITGDGPSTPGDSHTLSSSNSTTSLGESAQEPSLDKVNEKEIELKVMVTENKRLALEHKARMAKLQQEEDELKKLQDMKSKEAKETAELMRQKRKIEQELKEKEAVRRDEEENKYVCFSL